jgi:hypothetical protein
MCEDDGGCGAVGMGMVCGAEAGSSKVFHWAGEGGRCLVECGQPGLHYQSLVE